MAWPPSLPYPTQSSTWSRPLSAASRDNAAPAARIRVPNTAVPPAAAASFSRSPLLRPRSMISSSPAICVTSSVPVRASEARRADDPHDFGYVVARVHDPVWDRASIEDAVSRTQLMHLVSEVELGRSAEAHDELFGVAVRVRLVCRRPADVQLSDEDFEILEGPRREQELAGEDAEGQRGPSLTSQHAGARTFPVGLEQVGHAD